MDEETKKWVRAHIDLLIHLRWSLFRLEIAAYLLVFMLWRASC